MSNFPLCSHLYNTIGLGSEEKSGKNAKNRGKQWKKSDKNRGKFAAKSRHQIS